VYDDTGRVIIDVKQVVRDLAGAVLVDTVVQHAYLIEDGLIRTMEIRTVAAPASARPIRIDRKCPTGEHRLSGKKSPLLQ
jgi:hypothetical protein